MNCMVATDFFCKTVWTPLGQKVAYALVFIHLGSRKVLVSPSTFEPNERWVQQQARNVAMWAQDEGLELRFLIRDHDTKFTEAFDRHFRLEEEGPLVHGVVKTPFLAPIANCYAESWIGSLKRECLNHLICFSLSHLDHVTQTYATFYNTVRPHQGLGNVPPQVGTRQSPFINPLVGSVSCRRRLGGLLNHYYRKAA